MREKRERERREWVEGEQKGEAKRENRLNIIHV